MRIRHTVVFRLVHEPGSDQERAFLADGWRILSGIPGVEGFTVRRQVSAKSDTTFQFAMSFAGQREYDAYDAHPEHRAFVAQRWAAEVAAFQEYDFEPLPEESLPEEPLPDDA